MNCFICPNFSRSCDPISPEEESQIIKSVEEARKAELEENKYKEMVLIYLKNVNLSMPQPTILDLFRYPLINMNEYDARDFIIKLRDQKIINIDDNFNVSIIERTVIDKLKTAMNLASGGMSQEELSKMPFQRMVDFCAPNHIQFKVLYNGNEVV